MESPRPSAGELPDPLGTDDPSAWERIIESVGPASLLVFIRARLGKALAQRTSEEDVLQEALLHAWRDRRKCEWRGLRPFRRWLLQIIENRIRKLAEEAQTLRRGGDEVTLPFSAFVSKSSGSDASADGLASRLGAATSATPSRIASKREEVAAIEEAIAALPDELRDVVRLRLIDELELQEVAERVGIGISATRHRFRKGMELYRARLRRALVSGSQLAQAPFERSADASPESA